MAAGDLVTDDLEFEYNGLKLGGDTIYSLAHHNLADSVPVRSGDRNRFGDGQHAGIPRLGARHIDLVFDLDGADPDIPSTFDQAMDDFRAAFSSGAPESPLYFQIPGVNGGGKRFIDCRLDDQRAPGDIQFHYKHVQARTRLKATDPLVYDAALQYARNLSLESATAGLTFPLTFPLNFGTSVSNSFIASNIGNRTTYRILHTFRGPLVTPKVENITQGRYLEFALTLAAGDTLVVDVSSDSVLLNGVTNRYGTLTAGSEWFGYDQGGDAIRFSAYSGTGTFDSEWRSAWA